MMARESKNYDSSRPYITKFVYIVFQKSLKKLLHFQLSRDQEKPLEMGEEVNMAAAATAAAAAEEEEATVLPTTTSTTATATTTTTKQPVVLHFVLVHGISGGAWCWYKIKCLLENSGYKVSCIDLKSSGIDTSDANSILSFNDYNQPLLDFLSALPENEQVILVGHSAGGLSVTQASHMFGRKKIRLAVYVAATMLKLGYLTDQDLKNGVPDLSGFGDDVYELGFGLGSDQPPTSAIVKKKYQRKIIYQLSPQEDSTLAAMLLRPGPIQAILSAQFTEADSSDNGVERVPRVYIRTLHDHVVKPEQQEAMIKQWPPKKVYVLDSDHSPFFSAPFLLFGLIVKAVASVECD